MCVEMSPYFYVGINLKNTLNPFHATSFLRHAIDQNKTNVAIITLCLASEMKLQCMEGLWCYIDCNMI